MDPVKHDHPPIYGISKTCSYCQTYGNVLDKGPIKLDQSKIENYMKCFMEKRIFEKEEEINLID